MKKLGSSILLFLVIVLGVGLGFGQDVTMDLKMGVDGIFKNNSFTDMKISVKNSAADISGKIKVGFNDYSEQTRFKIFYSTDVELPSASEKEIIVTVPVDFESFMSTFKKATIIIEDDNGKELNRIVKKVNGFKEANETLVGIFTDQKEAVNRFSIVNSNGRSRTLSFADFTSEMPESLLTFSSFEGVFISNYNTSLFTEKEVKDIDTYVNNGGTLVVFLDQDYPRTLSGLSTIIDINPQDINGENIYKVNDSSFIYSKGIYSKKHGNGKIVLVEKALDSFKTQGEKNELIGKIFEEHNDFQNRNIYERLRYRLREAITSIPMKSFPKTSTIFMVLIGFSLSVGFVNYFVLKKLDKRDFGWITILVIILIFSSAISMWAGGNKFRKAVVNNVNFIALEDGVIRDWKGYMGVVNNTAKHLKVKANSNFYPTNEIKNIEYDSPQDEYEVELGFEPDGNYIDYNFTHIWDQKIIGYHIKGKNEMGIFGELVYTDSGVSLRIVNNTDEDYEHVVFEKNGQYAYLASIEKNSNREFKLNTLTYDDRYNVYDRNVTEDSGEIFNNRICSELLRSYESIRSGDGNTSRIIGFTRESFVGDVEVNGDTDLTRTNRNIVVSNLKYVLPKKGDVVIPSSMNPVEVVSFGKNIELDPYDGALYLNGEEGEVIFRLIVRDDVEPEKIEIDMVDYNNLKYSIYDLEKDSYVGVGNHASLSGEDFKKYLDGGSIMIKCTLKDDVGFEREDYPSFVLKGSVK